MKKNLKTLAMYLPYDLKCKLGIKGVALTAEINFVTDVYQSIEKDDINVFPILRPFSDIDKPIRNNGEEFIPLHRLLEHSNFNLLEMSLAEIAEYATAFQMVELINFNELPLYLEWRFDVAGLIEKGEAIDVNSLDVNLYA